MMGVLLAEWLDWNQPFALRLSALVALLAAALLLLSQLQPSALSESLVLAGLAAGWMSGSQSWNRLKSWDWTGERGVRPWAYLLGKVLGFMAAYLALVLPLLPFGVLLTLRWGIPWDVLALFLGFGLVSGVAALVVTHLVAFSASEFSRLLGLAVVGVWIVLSLQLPAARGWSPLAQVWGVGQGAAPGEAWASLAWLLLVTTAVGALVILVVKLRRGRA